jgi:hypothetical protein
MSLTEFNQDLNILFEKIKNGEKISLVRYGDGEYNIFRQNNYLCVDEFKYINNNIYYEKAREKLIKSIKYQEINYYVGIISACCYSSGYEGYKWMKEYSGQPENKLTWATIFGGANYQKALDEIVPILRKYETSIVLNKTADIKRLPFKVKEVFKIGFDAWINDYNIINDIKIYLNRSKNNNKIMLFSAGPLSKILIYELHKEYRNTVFIDIGSLFDQVMYDFKISRPNHILSNQIKDHHCKWY